MLEIVSKYDVEPSELMTGEGLARLTDIFVSEVEDLGSKVVSTQDLEKEVRESISEDHTVSKFTAERFNAVRNLVSDILNDDEESAVFLFVLLQELKSDVGNFRDYVVSTKARANRKAPENEQEIEEKRSDLGDLKEAIGSVWTLLGKPETVEVEETNEDGETSKRKAVTTKRSKSNELLLDLPRIPSVTKSGNVGRGAKRRNMVFTVNDEQVPEGYLFRDIVHEMINDVATGVSYSPGDIVSMVEDHGHQFTVEGEENAWTIEVGNVQLSGYLPVEEEENNEDS